MCEPSLPLIFPSPSFSIYVISTLDTFYLAETWSRRRSGSPVSRRFQHTTWDSTCGGRLVYVKRRTGLWANERPLYKFRHIRHGNPYFSANRKGPGEESELRSRAEIADRPAGRSRSEPGWNLTTVSGSQSHGSIEEYRTL